MKQETQQSEHGLFQYETFGSGPHLRMVRLLEDTEYEAFLKASALVRRVAFTTPHHEFEAAKSRFWASLKQANAETSESHTVRVARATAALTDLLTVVGSHHSAWRDFVCDPLGAAPPGVAQAYDRFEAAPSRQLAETLSAAPRPHG